MTMALCFDAGQDLAFREHAGLELPAALSTWMRTLAERVSASTAGLTSTTCPSKVSPG